MPVIAVGPARLLREETSPVRTHVPPRPAAGDAKDGYWLRTIDDDGGRGAPACWSPAAMPAASSSASAGCCAALRMKPGKVALPDRIELASAPKYPLRGHQLGYRPKTNSYDAWDLPQWERYIRDLALFGTNAIELIPPRSDDDADSPHFPRPPLEMMIGMSKICDDYGLDVWIWYPAMDANYADPKTVAHALEEWGEVFRKLPRIDAVFVPGGDPGHTQPKYLMALLEKQAASLHRFHPKAQMWVSPQSFSAEWLDEFLALLKAEPAWLGGVVYGPQVRVSLPELRKAVPAKYPIRDYPDITHSLRCQYPVPDWDVAYALTEGRETINPRPRDESAIFHAFADQTIGFITYSEGCNDDVNKVVWSALGWDPDADLLEVLRDYARCLVGLPDADADGFARGPLRPRAELARAAAGQRLGRDDARAVPHARAPRCRRGCWPTGGSSRPSTGPISTPTSAVRLIHETDLEERALSTGCARPARPDRSRRWSRPRPSWTAPARSRSPADLRARVFELAEALFQSIRMQLSVPRYKAISVGRGANLDTIDQVLNDREWLERRFAAIRKLDSEPARLKELDAIVDWTNPGPGGFYDDLGDPMRRPHLVPGPPYAEDPASLRGPMTAFDQDPGWRRSWCRHAGTLFGRPLQLHYAGLDREASYKVRIVYTGDMFQVRVRLVGRRIDRDPPLPAQAARHDAARVRHPREATRDGALELSLTPSPAARGNGRGCQVAEVWLIRK